MQQAVNATLSVEECGALEVRFAERAQRLETLMALDRALARAANRYNLVAQIVHYGWPHRAD